MDNTMKIKNNSTPYRLAMAQINPTVGDIRGNTAKIVDGILDAVKLGADMVAFPELAITGYPPEDLLLKPRFIKANEDALNSIIPHTKKIAAVVGFALRGDDGRLYNAAAVMAGGRLVDVYRKVHLPNYGVFDEIRYFAPGDQCPVYEHHGMKFGVTICEDVWFPEGPVRAEAEAGARLIVNINASPYHMGKLSERRDLVTGLARENGVAIAYLNTVGGQDELVFDGGSMVADANGRIVLNAPQFHEGIYAVDIDMAPDRAVSSDDDWTVPVALPETPRPAKRTAVKPPMAKSPAREAEVYEALLLGTRDYTRKNGFREVLVALSGGIDSSIVASVAVDALGAENVHGIFLPTGYTSGESRRDAFALAKNLGIAIDEIGIEGLFRQYLETLAPLFHGRKPDITEENIQARIRGNIVMAMSNKFNRLVLTTGNKSEMSVGYATLYGDMAGGFAVIKDVPKTLVYDLCAWRNKKARKRWIPENVLIKPPTAELRPNQKDTDSLPPYDALDPVLKAYVEDDKSLDEIISEHCHPECASRVIRMIDLSEYKRRQAPPGVKITARAFGRDRRYPITNRYRNEG
jgi:NAD+ synthase (glutamine-hydrolysing)